MESENFDEADEDSFYLVQNGSYNVTITNFATSKVIGDSKHQDIPVRKLEKNDFFGEVALLFGGQRSAQVTSTNYGCLTSLPGAIFGILCQKYPLFEKLLRHRIQYKYDDHIQMFLRSCLKNIDYMKHANIRTLNKLAYGMQYVPYETDRELFKSKDICDSMYCVLDGLVEVQMEFENEKTVVERFGTGTIINSFNFIVEEEYRLTARIASKSAAIYQISKNAFFDIVTSDKSRSGTVDKKLLSNILHILIDDVKTLDP